jgi:hypothetical protein
VRVISGLVGALILLATSASVLRTLVLPRGLSSRLLGLYWRFWRVLLTLLAGRTRRYETRDRLLAWLAPLVLVSTLASWLIAMFVGYGLIMHAASGLSWRAAFREAGSSLFTLGFASTDRLHLSAVDFAAAATGPLVIALQISYLPTLYAAYNRRETEVTLLRSRAGEPAWGPELLARQALVGTVDQLAEVYAGWERLAADIGESHANYPVLLTFRSPQPYRSWIVALLAVLDGAAMHLALAPNHAPPGARLALRAGFTALRDIANSLAVSFDSDPRPDAPLRLTFDEFKAGVDRVLRAGFRTERDAESAWPHFQGWRVNYESIVYELARRVDAVPAMWSGPRDWPATPMTTIRPPHRRPDAPEVAYPGDAVWTDERSAREVR